MSTKLNHSKLNRRVQATKAEISEYKRATTHNALPHEKVLVKISLREVRARLRAKLASQGRLLPYKDGNENDPYLTETIP